MTAHENVLIKMAKEVAMSNKIKERKEIEARLNEALDYIHAHLNEWYELYIDKMKKESWRQDPYNFIANECPRWCITRLIENKVYHHDIYTFRYVNNEYLCTHTLNVSVKH